MLYRIAERADWFAAQDTGAFASADLAAEGFIHTSDLNQVLETARRYYPGRDNLVLLEINEAAVAAAGVRVEREFVAGRGEAFAHVFGPVPLAAIGRLWPFATDAQGTAELPRELLMNKNK